MEGARAGDGISTTVVPQVQCHITELCERKRIGPEHHVSGRQQTTVFMQSHLSETLNQRVPGRVTAGSIRQEVCMQGFILRQSVQQGVCRRFFRCYAHPTLREYGLGGVEASIF